MDAGLLSPADGFEMEPSPPRADYGAAPHARSSGLSRENAFGCIPAAWSTRSTRWRLDSGRNMRFVAIAHPALPPLLRSLLPP